MNEDLRALYRELGYNGPLPESNRATRGRTREPEVSEGDAYELPPIDNETLRALEEFIKDNPSQAIAHIRNEVSYPLSDDDIKEMVSRARQAFEHPGEVLREERERKQQPKARKRSRGFIEPMYFVPEKLQQYDDIPIDPGNYTFEPRADALGWVFNGAGYWLREKLNIASPKAQFPWHDHFESNFVYELKDKDDRPFDQDRKLTVALFSDFGTGLYHSKFIARKIIEHAPDYAFHLGDVYYAGRFSEFKENFTEPLDPLLKTTRFFALNANHEMHSGAFPYFDYLRYKQSTQSGWVPQDQEGSYFCVRNDYYQFIGIDTAYHHNGRHNEKKLQKWLEARLKEGKSANPQRLNILLSPNEAYKVGGQGFSSLYRKDLSQFVDEGLIDYWFWGNTHYCALFDKIEKAPFIGSCVGHGGHPIYRKDIEENAEEHEDIIRKNKDLPAPIWVELSPRFPEDTKLRQEMGNHGYCMMELQGNSLSLTYYDWLGKKRFVWENS